MGITPFKAAPLTAPIVVAISKNMATRKFNISSFRKEIVAPELVAITTIILAPIAYLISRPIATVKIGVTIIPPPIPKTAPKIPANSPVININNKLLAVIIYLLLPFVVVESDYHNLIKLVADYHAPFLQFLIFEFLPD